MDMLEGKVMEETEPDLKGEEDFSISNDREEHWKEVEEEENQDRGKDDDLRWQVYIKYKEELIKKEILDKEPPPKTPSLSTPPYIY